MTLLSPSFDDPLISFVWWLSYMLRLMTVNIMLLFDVCLICFFWWRSFCFVWWLSYLFRLVYVCLICFVWCLSSLLRLMTVLSVSFDDSLICFVWWLSVMNVAVQKLHVFMQSRPVLDRQEHVLHRHKSDNLMLTLRSCVSIKFLTSWDKYLNFTPNYFKLNFLSDDIPFVYVNCVIVIGLEHPILIH